MEKGCFRETTFLTTTFQSDYSRTGLTCFSYGCYGGRIATQFMMEQSTEKFVLEMENHIASDRRSQQGASDS